MQSWPVSPRVLLVTGTWSGNHPWADEDNPVLQPVFWFSSPVWFPVLTQHSSEEVWTPTGSLGGKKQEKMFSCISFIHTQQMWNHDNVIALGLRLETTSGSICFHSNQCWRVCVCVSQCAVASTQPERSKKMRRISSCRSNSIWTKGVRLPVGAAPPV